MPNLPSEHAKGAESFIVKVLEKQAWTILARNYRRVGSEIDIIAAKGSTLIFVEVKYRKKQPRTLTDYEELIGYRKRKSLEQGSRLFLENQQQSTMWKNFRIDLAVVGLVKGKYKIFNYLAGI